jgi:hypothetical protein
MTSQLMRLDHICSTKFVSSPPTHQALLFCQGE